MDEDRADSRRELSSREAETSEEIAALHEQLAHKDQEYLALQQEFAQLRARVSQEDARVQDRQVLRQDPSPTPSTVTTKPLVKLREFDGKGSAIQWWLKFMTFIQLHGLSNRDALLRLPFYLVGVAGVWFDTLDASYKVTLETVKIAFIARFKPTSNLKLDLMDIKQLPNEKVDDFINRVTALTVDRPADPEMLLHVVSKGLRPSILKRVIQEDCSTLEELRRVANREEVAERIHFDSPDINATNSVNALEKIGRRLDSLEENNKRQTMPKNSVPFPS
ncbi:hypothetical protein FSP39_006539 [Pinctada imbricata]|uniref:Retrotransposon gag domain-containing protein n=1 Tax=Pinctada imbricata TaxID=66713 RepID=A0AA88YAP7_PINIB|nr:hypothetical protein FSP39_006539 [Pinctada imbricata]